MSYPYDIDINFGTEYASADVPSKVPEDLDPSTQVPVVPPPDDPSEPTPEG